MPIGNADIVRQVKSELQSKGISLSGACGAFRILNEVARRLAPQYYLLRKGGGNRAVPQPDGSCLGGDQTGAPGYATDYLIDRDTFYGYDILGDGGGANSPQWGAPETAADMVARNRVNFAPPLEWPPSTHKYIAGSNDPGVCDKCGRPRTDPVHAIDPDVQHEYHGGEQDRALCDLCQRSKDDPIHVGHSDTLAQKVVALEAKVLALEATIRSDALARRIAALEAGVQVLEAASLKYGQSIALRTDNGHLICAEGGGGNEVNATRGVIGGWETFVVEKPL